MDKITDYNELLQLQMEQWKSSPNANRVLQGLMDQGNKMEDALFEVIELTNLGKAEGVNLDVLGKPWNEARESRTDAAYKDAITLKKLEYYSGEPESIIAILKASYGASYVDYAPEYPGKYRVLTDAIVSNTDLDKISIAGVSGYKAGRIRTAKGFLLSATGRYIAHVHRGGPQGIFGLDGEPLLSMAGDQITTVEIF